MEGTLSLIAGKPFGFVHTDDKKVKAFVPPGSYRDMADGDRIQFEVEDDPKGKRAKDVKFLSKGRPTSKPSPSPPKELALMWETGSLTNGDLPITITLTRDAKAAPGVQVSLKVNKTEVSEPIAKPFTDGKGRVVFRATVPTGVKVLDLVAAVELDGSTKEYSHLWNVPEPPKPPADDWTIEATAARNPNPSTGLFEVVVVVKNRGQEADSNFVPSCSKTLTIKQFDRAARKLRKVDTFHPEVAGRYRLYIGFPGRMAIVTFQLDNDRKVTVTLTA